LPPTGLALQQAFESLIATLNEQGIRYALIGGLAVIQHTRPRTTDDIDALLAVPQLAMPALFEALRQRGFTVDPETNIRELRGDGFTTIQFAGLSVDLMQPVIPAYAHVLDRAISMDILGHPVRVSVVWSNLKQLEGNELGSNNRTNSSASGSAPAPYPVSPCLSLFPCSESICIHC
jgi:hypothetical protein